MTAILVTAELRALGKVLLSNIFSYYFAMSIFIYSTVWRNTWFNVPLNSPVRSPYNHGFYCLKIHTTLQFCDFKFNVNFPMTAKALYIGQRVHNKSYWKRRREGQFKDRGNVPSIRTTWKVLFSKLTC